MVALAFSFQLTSCTSKKSSDGSEIVDNADIEKIEAEDHNALSETGSSGGLDVVEDPTLQAALGETTSTDLDAPEATNTDTVTTENTTIEPSANVAAAPEVKEDELPAPNFDSEPPAEASSTVSTTMPEDSVTPSAPPTDTVADAPPAFDSAPTDTGISETPVTDTEDHPVAMTEEKTSTETTTTTHHSYNDTSFKESSLDTGGGSSSSSGKNTLKKIALTAPTQGEGGWINTVYVARPKESLKEISQKIYGADKSKELKAISENSFLKYRSAKAGDKIYYVSPNRPTDSAKTLFYYEDINAPSSSYVTQKGDTLKKVAKKLLGNERGWIELWTSNSIESKGKLAEGETLHYWEGSSAGGTTLADHMTPPPTMGSNIDAGQAQTTSTLDDQQNFADNNSMPPPPNDAALPPPPPPTGELPPPPTMAGNTADPGAIPHDAMNPPPPPPTEMAPPPPPPIDAAMTPKPPKHMDEQPAEGGGIAGLDNDTMMSLGAVGILTALLAFVLIRRKKKKSNDFSMHDETNVGT